MRPDPGRGDGGEDRLRVVQMGLGPVGVAIARAASERPGIELVGGVDVRSGIVGRDLGELISGVPSGQRIESEVTRLVERERAAVVLHATGSFLVDVAPQLEEILATGVSVVSTCEELAYPFYRHPELTARLDTLARWKGAVLLGAGVNPGFVLDKLAVTLLGVCRRVERVRGVRVVDAALRREPLQRKIGAGATVEEFAERRRNGPIGHIGLAESAHMIADAIGVSPGRRLEEELRPVLADAPVTTPHLSVEAGQVAGIEQSATITEPGGVERVRLELRMFVGAKVPHDQILIEGSPPIEMTIRGGVHGDEATAAIVVNCAELVRDLRPGLRTMLDVPICFGAVQPR